MVQSLVERSIAFSQDLHAFVNFRASVGPHLTEDFLVLELGHCSCLFLGQFGHLRLDRLDHLVRRLDVLPVLSRGNRNERPQQRGEDIHIS